MKATFGEALDLQLYHRLLLGNVELAEIAQIIERETDYPCSLQKSFGNTLT